MTNQLHPQDARTQSKLNRDIIRRKPKHSKFWTTENFIEDRDHIDLDRTYPKHLALPAPKSAFDRTSRSAR